MLSDEIRKIHEEAGIVELTIDDPRYPDKLRQIEDPPGVLYVKGDLELLNGEKHAAVIGARKVSMKGMDVAIGLGNMLALDGEIVVSGLAQGCDTGGHLGCMGAGGGTIAILPSPITQIMPRENEELAARIVETGGLLVTEYPHGVPVTPEMYIARDRLQAAMSEGLIVVESFLGGGTMHTVDFALDMGKLVGAYRHPGGFDMTDVSEGNEYLIKERGVVPIKNINDVKAFIEEMNERRRNQR